MYNEPINKLISCDKQEMDIIDGYCLKNNISRSRLMIDATIDFIIYEENFGYEE